MGFARHSGLRPLFGFLKWLVLAFCGLSLAACGASTPPISSLDETPPDFYDGGKILQDVHLVDLVAENPLFDITDKRGIHYGTLALMAGERTLHPLPVCTTAIPGPFANCSPRGARIGNVRLSVGVVEFGGETGLYYIDQQAICFSRMSTIEGCHQLAIHYDSTIEVTTSYGEKNYWILR